jgi:hypothetical protein
LTRSAAVEGLGAEPTAPVTGQALESGAMHQQLDLAVPDVDATAQEQFGAHPVGAVDAVGRVVDCGDLLGEPGVAQRTLRGGCERHA